MLWTLALFLAAVLPPGLATAAPCPSQGGTLVLGLTPLAEAAANTLVLSGALLESSCDDAGGLTATYEVTLTCTPDDPGCQATVTGLRPGRWIHRIEALDGETAGRRQARTTLVLDASAGAQQLTWRSYRSLQTVATLDDAVGCADCLRAVLLEADASPKPVLLQFDPAVAGTIVLAAPLPPLAGGGLSIDGFDLDGRPHRRSLDGNGLNAAALRITSAANRVAGLRLANAGGNSDTLLIEGAEANANLLDHVAVQGRAVAPCLVGSTLGCVLDGVCVVPTPDAPRGACGDDGIAVRDFAGAAAANVVRHAEVRGAFDKGIKASEGGVVHVERSLITANTDGGLQATLGGSLTASANEVRGNRGTPSASGIAANGAAPGSLAPARLETRGNLVLDNALRGLSVRSQSLATLRDDFVCGNGTVGRSDGFGVAVFDAAGRSARADLSGVALVHNLGGGAVVAEGSLATFGNDAAPGRNALAFNGSGDPLVPVNLRNETSGSLDAIGNQWQHCGPRSRCDLARVRARDIFRATPSSSVRVGPALPTAGRAAPVITAIDPPAATAGELVRIYGHGFDAVEGAGTSCQDVEAANGCRPVRGTCVFIDRRPAAVVAATPTMLVVRAPFTCVAPVPVAARTRRSRGFARATFCTAPPAAELG